MSARATSPCRGIPYCWCGVGPHEACPWSWEGIARTLYEAMLGASGFVYAAASTLPPGEDFVAAMSLFERATLFAPPETEGQRPQMDRRP